MLASLLDGPLHGYAIIQRAAEHSENRVRLATGTLYTALDRLTAEGSVRLVRDEVVNGRTRHYYGLTDSGTAELRREAARMAEAAKVVTSREHRSACAIRWAEGVANMTNLDRRYRRLLCVYPARYRRERGEEILDTLLETTPPDRRWPTIREGRALLAGGLRVLCGLNQRLTMAAHLRMAALLGVMLMLLQLATFDMDDLILFWRSGYGDGPGIGHQVAYLALTAVVLLAAFVAPRRFVAAASWITAMLWFWWDGDHGEGVLAAVLLITLASLVLAKRRMPRLWLCVPGALLAVHMLQTFVIWGSPYLVAGFPLGMVLSWAVLGCVVLCIGLDPRPAIGVAFYIVLVVADSSGPFSVQPHLSWQMTAYATGAAIVAAIALWRLYHGAAVRRSGKEHDDPEVADLGGPART